MVVQGLLPGVFADDDDGASPAQRLRMKGFVPTPEPLVDAMVATLFAGKPPTAKSRLLDPGCGTGAFIEGVLRWCEKSGSPLPEIVGVESDPRHIPALRALASRHPSIRIQERDFLVPGGPAFDYVVGNPPYVPITQLSDDEKGRYRANYSAAVGRFDLYLLFLEESLRQLKPLGRLVFITPEKFLYVETAAPIRRLLASLQVESIELVREDAFGSLVTYPTITTVVKTPASALTQVSLRDGTARAVSFSGDGSSWLPVIRGYGQAESGLSLEDICVRVSCGVATGADGVFVLPREAVSAGLLPFAHPTIAGRELDVAKDGFDPRHAMLIPYDRAGTLLPLEELGALRAHMERAPVKDQLLKRTCVRKKPWYAFHENPPMDDILRPKIICKDIGPRPRFWVDHAGDLVPRHSVYYAVPKMPESIVGLADYLNSDYARGWLEAHCARAANGFLRLQSRVLRRLPVPASLAEAFEEPKLAAAR